jgi:anti-sigma regulatory factor (Ser/Thr protein kinase)
VIQSLDERLAADEDAPSAARRAVADLEGVAEPGMADIVSLLVSELVTNAVLHAGREGDPIVFRGWTSPRCVRIEVTDRGRGFDRSDVPRTTRQDGGWGLRLRERLANRWGVKQGPASSTVWLELDRRAAARAA